MCVRSLPAPAEPSPPLHCPPGCPAQVLDALTEIAFEPEFLPSRIEKERKAVVAEAQMMNTIEYRVDCQLLQVRGRLLPPLPWCCRWGRGRGGFW